MQRVPFQVITTGDQQLDRVQQNVAQAVRSLQDAAAVPSSISTNVSISLAKQTTVIILDTATKAVTVSLPNAVPLNQATQIRNDSSLPVHVRTADALTVLADVAPGATGTVVANGSEWRNA